MTGDCIYTTDVCLDKDGYPRVKWQKRMWRLNRLVFTLVHGDIPEGNVIGHSCNNTGCINPHHLYLTTATENSTQAKIDGLYRTGHLCEKIKEAYDDWFNICVLYHEHNLSQKTIAEMYSTNQGRISEVIRANKENYEGTFSSLVV